MTDVCRTAYRQPIDDGLRTQRTGMLAGAALCCIGIIPFTLLAMVPTNNRLHELAAQWKAKIKEEVSQAEEKEVNDLLAKWKRLNYLRAVFPLMGFCLAAFAPR